MDTVTGSEGYVTKIYVALDDSKAGLTMAKDRY